MSKLVCQKCGFYKEIHHRSSPRWCKECIAEEVAERTIHKLSTAKIEKEEEK